MNQICYVISYQVIFLITDDFQKVLKETDFNSHLIFYLIIVKKT